MTNLPTKTELLQTSFVTIDQHHKKVITNSLQIAVYFKKRPSEINRRIAILDKKGLCRTAPSYYLNQQGKKQKYFELKRDQFLLVVLGFNGHQADQFKAEFIQLFNKQETELLQWRKQAFLTTQSTKQANDQVFRLKNALVEVIPSSKRCTMLFIHLQQGITKAVTGSAKTQRVLMTTHQLNNIERLENRVQQEIEQMMDHGIAAEKVRDNVMSMLKIQAQKNIKTKALGFQNSTININCVDGIRLFSDEN